MGAALFRFAAKSSDTRPFAPLRRSVYIGAMKRISFNGGEVSPGIAARPDLDVYHRGASVLENVDVAQTGGVSRRRGMKRVIAALEGSVMVPYEYSTNDRYLVEVSSDMLRVLSVDGDVVASRDLTVFADHVLKQGGGVTSGSFVKKPHPRAVMTLADGTMALMTYNSMHQVHAWHRHRTEGRMSNAVTLPNGNRDDLLFVFVDREDGRFIEVFDPDGPFVDAGTWDFTSTVLTNALDTVESMGKDRQAAAVRVFFASDTAPSGIEVSNDGATWARLGKTRTMERGWHELLPVSQWRRGVQFGVRVSGDRPLEFLAVDTQ